MVAITPQYKLVIYGSDDVTALVPRAGSPHAEPFQVATHVGITGFRPYLDFPEGRKSRLDLLSRKVDVGQMQFPILDARLVAGGDNLSRWLTAFIGDPTGKQLLLGKRVTVQESVMGAAFQPFFAGRIHDVALGDGRQWMDLTVREYAEELKAEAFAGASHATITYAGASSLMPLGPPIPYGGFPATPKVPATVRAWSVAGAGSGSIVRIDKHRVKAGEQWTDAALLNESLSEVLDRFPSITQGTGDPPHPDVLVEITLAGGAVGLFRLVRFAGTFMGSLYGMIFLSSQKDDADRRWVTGLGIKAREVGEPGYMAIPAAETQVDVRLLYTGPPDKSRPFYIADIHPVVLWRDVLDGKFGNLSSTGVPQRPIPYDAAAFASRIADPSHGLARFQIVEPQPMNEFVEKHICAAFGLGYRFDGGGATVPYDVRRPSSLAGVLTITNADLAAVAPGWETQLDGTIAEMVIKYYSDGQDDPYVIQIIGGVVRAAPTWVFEVEHEKRAIVRDSPGLGRAKPLEIDARGIRYSRSPGTDLLVGLERQIYALGMVNRIIEDFRSVFAGGPAVTTLTCLRTANVTGCQVGDLRLIDVDEIPDAATNLRGGRRVGRCIGRHENGPVIELTFLDLGSDSIAVAPTLSGLALVATREQQAASLTVTLNALAEPAVLQLAATPIPTAFRPAENSERWVHAARVTTTSAQEIRFLPSGSRIWFRARSEPVGSGAKLSSGWVFPPGVGYVDTQGLPAPTGLTIISVTGTEAKIGFTPGNAAWATEVFAGVLQVDTLPAGSTLAHIKNLEPATGYLIGLRHRDDRGGFSSTSTVNIVTAGARDKAPDIVGISVLVGETG